MANPVERLSRRRRILLIVLPSLFLVWQVPRLSFVSSMAPDHLRAVDFAQLAGSTLWILGMVLLFVWGGRVMRQAPAEARAALEDELVRSNRSKAFGFGYLVTVLVAALVFGANLFLTLSGGDSALLILMAAVTSPMYAFAWLER